MPNPLTLRFLNDVKRLLLRFPVAEISRDTNYPKSSVSEFLRGKKEPSSSFLRKFYSVYFPEFEITDDMFVYEAGATDQTDDYIESLKKIIATQEKAIEHLEKRIRELEGKHEDKGKAGGRRRSA